LPAPFGAVAAPDGRGAARRREVRSRVLTVAGAVSRTNRGPIDPALDQLMVKHGRTFDAAYEFDAAMLARLPP
jgi:hypothetical protein